MDERQHAELRRWATRLQESGSNEELRAAGRAILLLTEEVAQLTLQLEAARPTTQEPLTTASVPQPAADDEAAHDQGARSWIRRTFGMDVDDEEEYEESR